MSALSSSSYSMCKVCDSLEVQISQVVCGLVKVFGCCVFFVAGGEHVGSRVSISMGWMIGLLVGL